MELVNPKFGKIAYLNKKKVSILEPTFKIFL